MKELMFRVLDELRKEIADPELVIERNCLNGVDYPAAAPPAAAYDFAYRFIFWLDELWLGDGYHMRDCNRKAIFRLDEWLAAVAAGRWPGGNEQLVISNEQFCRMCGERAALRQAEESHLPSALAEQEFRAELARIQREFQLAAVGNHDVVAYLEAVRVKDGCIKRARERLAAAKAHPLAAAASGIDLGPCCHCESTAGVNTILMLKRRGPVAGIGWGCFQCGLPFDGAVAVLCDGCLEAGREIKFVCKGRVDGGRVPVEELSEEVFEHIWEFHPEEAAVLFGGDEDRERDLSEEYFDDDFADDEWFDGLDELFDDDDDDWSDYNDVA